MITFYHSLNLAYLSFDLFHKVHAHVDKNIYVYTYIGHSSIIHTGIRISGATLRTRIGIAEYNDYLGHIINCNR